MTIKSPVNLLLLFILFAFIACSGESTNEQSDDSVVANPEYGAWQEANTQPITFERVLTIGNNEDLILPSTYELNGPVTDEAGNIYFIDSKNGKLYSFDPQGNMRWKTGNVGKGPGDFQQPRGLISNGKYLYTANVQGSRLDKFNLQGELVESNALEEFDLSFSQVEGFIGDTLLVLGSTTWEKVGRKVTILNVADTIKIHSQYEVTPAPPLELGPGLSHGLDISIIDSFIVAGNVENYALFFYDLQGNRVKSITRNFDGLVAPGFMQNNGRRAVASFSRLYAPVNLKNGYHITTLGWPTNVEDPNQFLKQAMEKGENAERAISKNAIDLYDKNGTLLYTIENDGNNSPLGTIAYVDEDGFLYTKSNEPFPQIRKYKVTISPPGE